MDTGGATRILLIDDHPLLRLAVRDELAAAGFEIIGEAADTRQALRLAERTQPDICLLDLYIPDARDGLELVRTLRSRCPGAAVVVLTASGLKVDLEEALTAGARGYLLKDDDPHDLPHQLAEIQNGGRVVSTGIHGREAALAGLRAGSFKGLDDLSSAFLELEGATRAEGSLNAVFLRRNVSPDGISAVAADAVRRGPFRRRREADAFLVGAAFGLWLTGG